MRGKICIVLVSSCIKVQLRIIHTPLEVFMELLGARELHGTPGALGL